MKIAIKYPQKNKEKVYVWRILESNAKTITRVSAIVDIPEEILPDLASLGSEIIDIDNNTSKKEDNDSSYKSLIKKMVIPFIKNKIVINLNDDEISIINSLVNEIKEKK